jgi:hypothetical protein
LDPETLALGSVSGDDELNCVMVRHKVGKSVQHEIDSLLWRKPSEIKQSRRIKRQGLRRENRNLYCVVNHGGTGCAGWDKLVGILERHS